MLPLHLITPQFKTCTTSVARGKRARAHCKLESFMRSSFCGHSKMESTVHYLGIEVDDAIEIAEKVDI